MHQPGHKPHLGGTWLGGDPNSWAPEVWENIIKTKKIKSVIDVGCGDGYSLKWFKDHGLKAMGIEGDEHAVKRCEEKGLTVFKHDYYDGPLSKTTDTIIKTAIPLVSAIIEAYRNKKIQDVEPGFDLVWCCEFVEHLHEEYIPNFLETFRHGRYLAVTHAFPGQPGYHHVNCQWPEYWIPKIEELGYILNRPYTLKLRSLTKALHINRSLLFFEKS